MRRSRAHLRIKLLNCTTRRVEVTTGGQAYYDRMARLLEEWDEVEDELARPQPPARAPAHRHGHGDRVTVADSVAGPAPLLLS